MKEDYNLDLEKALSNIPKGTFEIKKHSNEALLTEELKTRTSGKGIIEYYRLFSGIEMSYHRYLANEVHFEHSEKPYVLEVNHCKRGRIGWNMKYGNSVYLGEGDICIHSMESCAESVMTLPLGYSEGIGISINLKEIEKNTPDILKDINCDFKAVYNKLCKEPLGVPSNSRIESIFLKLYDLPDNLKLAYYKLKAQEILLYLLEIDTDNEKKLTQYNSEQTELIKEIRSFLIDNLDKRYTIDFISKKYHINTSTLKAVFKNVYGLPIGAYVKECRIEKAKRLLKETDYSIALIAEMVGYETQSKLTKAFKDSTNVLPREYRRLYR